MSAAHQHEHGGHGGGSTMGMHGMLLFGTETLYLSHLPMFMHPHNFQVILEVALDDAAAAAVRADREAGADLHTFTPDEFPITELDPAGGGPARTVLEGTVWRGHFERGGERLTAATARVRQVVHFQEFDVGATHQPDRDLGYLCFGLPGQLHLAHEITGKPDFDQVLTVALVPGTLTDQAGNPVTILPASQVVRLLVPAYVQEDPSLAGVLSESMADRIVDKLSGKTVKAVLPKPAPRMTTVTADDTIVEVAATMAANRSPLVAVMGRDGLIGVITAPRLLQVALGSH